MLGGCPSLFKCIPRRIFFYLLVHIAYFFALYLWVPLLVNTPQCENRHCRTIPIINIIYETEWNPDCTAAEKKIRQEQYLGEQLIYVGKKWKKSTWKHVHSTQYNTHILCALHHLFITCSTSTIGINITFTPINSEWHLTIKKKTNDRKTQNYWVKKEKMYFFHVHEAAFWERVLLFFFSYVYFTHTHARSIAHIDHSVYISTLDATAAEQKMNIYIYICWLEAE